MDSNTINKVAEELKTRYPEVGIRSIELGDNGTATFMLNPTQKSLAFLGGEDGMSAVTPRMRKASASTIRRDAVDRSVLDLMGPKDAFDDTPQNSIKRANRYHYVEPLVGSTNNLLASLSAKGFENDIDDPDIKNFYDTWVFDVNFEEIVEWIFLEFFKTGNVFTYKVLQKYEPRVSTISANPGKKPKQQKATAAKKTVWSKGFMPVAYTVLNPELVDITGSLLFDKNSIALRIPQEFKEMLKKDKKTLSQDELDLIAELPPELKKAAEAGTPFLLDSVRVGKVFYRKQPYERYARPRAIRVFDAIDYKNALRQADLSTLDGISNYILKVTIGSDEFPVTSQAELEAVAKLFNTSSKSFDVVWNHTLKVEKIVSPEISSILGKAKYEQVNDDLTAGLAIVRSLIDGTGASNAAEVSLGIKGLTEEVNYARRAVTRWIYREYQQIAEVMGFDRFPKIRWDEAVLKDTILYMTTLAQMVDRRMLSYRTSLESLGFDYDNELFNMQAELPLVTAGTFGVVGSPFQKSAPIAGNSPNNDLQPTQNSPKGTPSAGRPKGQPAKPKTTETNPSKIIKSPKKTATLEDDALLAMTDEEYSEFINTLNEIRGNRVCLV